MSKPVCQIESNKARCNCTYQGCPRHGLCCECLAYHLNSRELPACAFPGGVEKTWGRSFAKYIETYRWSEFVPVTDDGSVVASFRARPGIQKVSEVVWIPAPRFRGDKLHGNGTTGTARPLACRID
jgi:hypothetical protein